jgi:hypothetical protein
LQPMWAASSNVCGPEELRLWAATGRRDPSSPRCRKGTTAYGGRFVLCAGAHACPCTAHPPVRGTPRCRQKATGPLTKARPHHQAHRTPHDRPAIVLWTHGCRPPPTINAAASTARPVPQRRGITARLRQLAHPQVVRASA